MAQHDCENRDGNLADEAPPPANVVRNQSAQRRTTDRAEPVQDVLTGLIHSPLLERNHVRVDDGRHGYQTSATQSTQRSHDIQGDNVRRQATSKTPQKKCDGRGEEARSATQNVREATIQWLERRARDQVRGRQPRDGVGGVEIGADDRICRGRNGAVEAREENVGKDG